MRRLASSFFVLAAMAFAAGWTGTLFDADCKQPGNPSACPVTAATRHFGIVRKSTLSHPYYVIAEEGNVKIAAALADRQKKTGNVPQGSNVQVWFTGKPEGHKLALKDFALK